MISRVLAQAAPPVTGAAIAMAVVGLLHRAWRPARASQLYIEDIRAAISGTVRNLDLAEELSRLGRLPASGVGERAGKGPTV